MTRLEALSLTEIRLMDVVQMRKTHPCGSNVWTVIRVGADIKIKCQGCGRIVMMDRADFVKRLKKTLSQGPAVDAAPAGNDAASAEDASRG